MVSLENNINYLKSLEDKPNLIAFYNLLHNKAVLEFRIDDKVEIDRFYFNFVQHIITNNKRSFENYFNEFSKRIPTSESVWIYKDILIFTMIVGVVKFNLNIEWISNTIQLRLNTQGAHQPTSLTFLNLLKGNFNSTDNIFEIVIVFIYLLNFPLINAQLTNSVYNSLITSKELFKAKNDFITLISIRALDIIIISKDLPDAKTVSNLRAFKDSFESRVANIQLVIYILLIIILLVLYFYLAIKSEETKQYLTEISILFGLFGAGVLIAVKQIKLFIGWLLKKIFGYNKHFNIAK